jgi:hypothetical protein
MALLSGKNPFDTSGLEGATTATSELQHDDAEAEDDDDDDCLHVNGKPHLRRFRIEWFDIEQGFVLPIIVSTAADECRLLLCGMFMTSTDARENRLR